jgi:eukaryotic-like serine/threonine-protein kinase
MTQDSYWKQIKQIFSKALELDGEERHQYIEDVCGGDERLRSEVLSLLESHDKTGMIDKSIDEIRMSAIMEARSRHMKGEVVGRYKIIKEIGYGGMGNVFQAERSDGEFNQKVALKLLRDLLPSAHQVERFRSERQILASLSHGQIARLFDGGVTEKGQPWFAMELVEGQPITTYCDQNKLTVEERLKLFLDVCSAVQYAHRKLVVHRDLKPSNILVTVDCKVKLLDFGIAKVVDEPASGEGSPLTRQGIFPLTPSYASPEQIKGEAITTASDIYQLGLVLYELLSGSRPYDLTGKSPAGMEQTICETEPVAPVQKLVNGELATNDPEKTAVERGIKLPQLRKKLRGDIGTVVMKALRKEPDRRYESAEQFAGDIRRCLAGKPIQAHPDSRLYRAKKFIHRNPAETIAAAIILILMAGYIVTITWHTQRTQAALADAEREAEKSEQVVEFLMGMFEAGDPYKSLGDTVTAGVLLERGLNRAEQLNSQPGVQAQMFEIIGRVYRELGEYEKAWPALDKAITLREGGNAPPGIQTADNYYKMGTVMHHMGRYRESDNYFNKALEIYREHPEHKSPEYASSLYSMAGFYSIRGEFETAEKMHIQALEMRLALLNEVHPDVAESYQGMGNTQYMAGNIDGAFRKLQKALKIYEAVYHDDHPVIAGVKTNLAGPLQKLGYTVEAGSYLETALSINERVFGEHHTQTGISKKALADFYRSQAEYASAEAIYLELKNSIEENHPLKRPVVQALANMYMEAGDPERAEPLLRQTIHLLESVLNPEHPRVLTAHLALGSCLIKLGEFEEAEARLLAILNERAFSGNARKGVLQKIVELYESWDRESQKEIYSEKLTQLAASGL